LRSASSKKLWLLLSIGAAVGLLAWSAADGGRSRNIRSVLGEVLTAIVTPFHPDGSVNLEKFRELAAHLVAHGSDGLVVAGTTGESPTLTDDEKLQLFVAARDAVGDRATIVAGTGTYDTAHSVHLTKQATELGVDAILVVTPYYNKPPQRGIVRHFQEIAAATDKPVIVYNIPSRVVVNIEPETMAELAKIPNVRAVKQAHDDLDQARRIPELGLDLYAGDDVLIFPFLALGGVGGICVHTHVWGPQTKEMIRLYKSGDVDGAHALNDEMQPAFDLLKIVTNPIAIKAALNLLGHEVGGYRLPMVEPTEHELDQVRGCLERAGVLEPARL
jgi:4-hydroxy-tetrahydrodipicolinate synthase